MKIESATSGKNGCMGMLDDTAVGVPQGYNQPDGCWNCYHIFIYSDYDEGYTYYCTRDQSVRPLCGSVALNEDLGDELKKQGFGREDTEEWWEEYGKAVEEWEMWSDAHKVNNYGICPEWEFKEDGKNEKR